MPISQRPNVVALVVVVALFVDFLSYFKLDVVPIRMVVVGASVDYCYSDIGCFPLSDEFYHPRHRPFNVRPWHRQRIRTQFELFNRQHPGGFMMVPWDRTNLLLSKFNPKLETKIIVPGWLDNINRTVWIKRLRDALLWLWAPANIIVVRWTNFTPYTVATANTRVVGAEIANLMKFIDSEFGYDPAYYHIIGHSLGAHIAGYCGDRIHGLGRITALDPARPFFQHMPKSVRLDRGDARFVDAIHSDFTPENAILLIMSFGMTTPVGHVDFYPNGPPLFQPGCIRDTLLSVRNGIAKGLEHNSLPVAFLESARYLTACDHQRSHEWFIESITNRECAFVGVRCNEYEGMINGRCTCDDSPSACAIMGIHADQMYLNNVHEELWPVRAGSIDFKHRHKRPAAQSRPVRPAQAWDELNVDILAHHDESNLRLHDAVQFGPQQQQQQQQQQPPVTKNEIYSQLKYQAMQMHNQDQPSVAAWALDALAEQTTAEDALGDGVGGSMLSEEAPAPEDGDLLAAASDFVERAFEQRLGALNDLAFAGYLRSQLLLDQLDALDSRSTEAPAHKARQNSTSSHSSDLRRAHELDHQAENGHPAQFGGHPELISSVNRDIENWYEDNSRWHLKTNNRPAYCSNQYQLLIFLGPLKSSKGRDRLRADLLVSIVGSKGQLLNQRFIPRGSTLTSFTMQPFFILLEGSYTLGQIKSVSLSWEARNDPDPVQATVSFHTALGFDERFPALKTKEFSWPPVGINGNKYDKTPGFTWQPPTSSAATRHLGRKRKQQLHGHLKAAIQANIAGHYSRSYAQLDHRTVSERHHGLKRSRRHSEVESFGRAHKRPAECSQPKSCPEFDSHSSKDALKTEPLEEPRSTNQRASNKIQAKQNVSSRSIKSDGHFLDLAQLRMLNQTYLADGQKHSNANVGQRKNDLVMSSSEPYLLSLINPIDEMANHLPGPDAGIPPNDLVAHEQGLTIDLHNVDLGQSSSEDSIIVNQVIVSPLQANYGRYGRTAKVFCPSLKKRKLRRDMTLQLSQTLMNKCSEHHEYQRQTRLRLRKRKPTRRFSSH
jgi:hypothetical protein